MNDKDGPGTVIAKWWRAHIADRESGRARALAARLRRAEGVAVLAEPEVHGLAAALRLRGQDAARLVALAQALAGVRENSAQTLAQRLGGRDKDDRVMSPLRFQRLLRSRDEEFSIQLRRALLMAGRECDVGALGRDVLAWDHSEWGDKVRTRWAFNYFGASDARTEQETEAQDLEISA